MINSTMVKGTMIVRATKVPIENSNDYYFEFQLNDMQVQQFVAELLLESHKMGNLTILKEDNKKTSIEFLKEILNSNPNMNEETKQEYYDRILELSK